MTDSGGISTGTDRRKHRYITYFPEKRSGKDRRKGFDRREVRDPVLRIVGDERREAMRNLS